MYCKKRGKEPLLEDWYYDYSMAFSNWLTRKERDERTHLMGHYHASCHAKKYPYGIHAKGD
jgi:hypothetical protein